MSKSLKQQVMAEMRRREREEEKQQEELRKRLILDSFEMELKSCLEQLTDFRQCEVKYVEDRSRLHNKAARLGFVSYERMQKRDQSCFYDFHLVMMVPEFKRGEGQKRTQAQQWLYRFRKELKKAREERKKELLETCKKVKEEIEAGRYAGRLVNSGSEVRIEIKAETVTKNDFEKEVVSKYFSKYKITVESSDGTVWSLKI